MSSNFDLLTTMEYGGCSAKIPAGLLSEMLGKLSVSRESNPDLLVDAETHDDAGVYRLNSDTALIFTTDFFPPICSDPFEFGEIAACNALSDIYAMGGKPLLALNLVMFSRERIPMDVLGEILSGGASKAKEADTLIVGGHTLDDHPPKYGLAIVGTVHPDRLITNAGARPGDVLILTKPLGTGALVSGRKNGLADPAHYRQALDQMKVLNRAGGQTASRYGIRGMTDITGFGLAGHAMKMADASRVSFRVRTGEVPLLSGAFQVYEKGSIPGATFRNREFTDGEVHFTRNVPYSLKMMVHDAQTSGGLLMAVPADHAEGVVADLNPAADPSGARVIGEVLPESPRKLYFE